jgi:hypothetical protein
MKKKIGEEKSEMLLEKVMVRLEILEEKFALLEKKKEQKETPSIMRVEAGEMPHEVRPGNDLLMDEEMKIQSMKNAIAILPPNYVVNGRHSVKNIEALCGFKISEEMMDKAYEGITHEGY